MTLLLLDDARNTEADKAKTIMEVGRRDGSNLLQEQ